MQPQSETRTREEYYDVLSSGRGHDIVGFAALMAERPASERHEWQIPLSRSEVDRCGLGVIDERSKSFSAAERRIAEHLAAPGPAVVSVSEGYGIYGRTADARGLTACSIAILDRRDVVAFFERNPGAWPKLVEVLCDRLRRTDQHLAEMALLEIPLRLAKVLLRMLVDREASPSAPKIALSQRELGNIVGASRESVNKCLNEWQRRGIVRIDDNLITIANRKVLEQMADPDFS